MSRYGSSQFSSLLKDCVLWWPGLHCAGYSGDFDEFPIIPSGVTVTNNGTFTKTDLGNNRKVLNFDGTTNYILLTNLGNSMAFSTKAATWCGWYWISSSISSSNAILSKYVTWPTDLDFNLVLSYPTLTFRAYIRGAATPIVISSSTLQTNNWIHFALTKSESGNYILYIDGNYVSTITDALAQTNNSTTLTIGKDATSNTEFLKGNLKDLMIWKGRALTQDEIKLLMNRTHPITGRGLIDTGRYWRLT